MSLAGLKKFFTYIGKNNKPIYPVMAVASAEIIFRPLFTMMDKKSPEETKKYTALREGITEIVAVPTYWACGELAAKGADLFKDPKAAMRAKHNLMTAGVWTAALLVIPGLCSLVVKPFTDRIYKNKQKKEQNLDITDKTEEIEPIANKQPITSTGRAVPMAKFPMYNYKMTSFANMGMKVGL